MRGMRWVVFLGSLWLAFGPKPALADPLPWEFPDASLPDASVGHGGADQTSEETDTGASSCLSDRDCDQGLHCRNGVCVYQRWRDAEYRGCGATALWPAAGVMLAFAERRRRYLRPNLTK